MASMRELFNSKLLNIMTTKKSNSAFLTRERYNQLLKKVSDSKSKKSGKKPEDYQRLKRYDIIKVDNVEKLIFPVNENTTSVRFYVYFEQLFDIIHETHLSIGHGGRNRMLKELQKRYKNITTEEVVIYLNLCESCKRKSKAPRKENAVRPKVFQEINSRCQVDLIDMQSQPDNDFKYILVYQDHLTKFVQLRALKSKCPKEVAGNLIDIFTIFGAPIILQSEDGREFSKRVVEEACAMWPDLKIVNGKSNAESANEDIENMLKTWLESNQTRKWSEGLRFVQLMKNRAYHEGIKRTPYEAMFGTSVKVGLKTSFPTDSMEHVKTEEDLQALFQTDNSAFTNTNSDIEDESDMDNSLQNDPPQVKFKNQKDPGRMVPLVQKDILKKGEQVRKRSTSNRKGLESPPKKLFKVSNLKFPSGKVRDPVKLQMADVDPQNLLEVILDVQNDEIY